MVKLLSGYKRLRLSRTAAIIFISILISLLPLLSSALLAGEEGNIIDLGLSSGYYEKERIPRGWRLREHIGRFRGADAKWVMDNGRSAVKLHSRGAVTFLEKVVGIDIKEFQVVTWRWKAENILEGVDERKHGGDDHPIRIFFALEPDPSRQPFWLRLKRFIYLDRLHGHPVGGRFTEYLWSSNLKAGEIINDPDKPTQKLIVAEGGSSNLGKWISYKRNLYEDFKGLYREEPRRLIFIGILNDTDQTGQEAVSYIADLMLHKAAAAD